MHSSIYILFRLLFFVCPHLFLIGVNKIRNRMSVVFSFAVLFKDLIDILELFVFNEN